MSQVEGKLVDTERRYSDAESRYSDAERRWTETTEHHLSDLESLEKNFQAISETLREKLGKIAEVEAALANLTAENSRLMQENGIDADALADLRESGGLLDLELAGKDGKISDLTDRLQSFESLQAEKLELERKLSEATKLYVGLETDKNKIIKETSAGLNSALLESQQRDTTIFQLKSEIADWKAKFGYSEDRSRNLKQELSEMMSNFDLIRIESQDKDRLFSEMQSNLKKISEKEKIIQTMESDNKTLSRQLDAALVELELLKSICETQETKVGKLESDLSQVEGKLVSTERQYSDADRRYSDAERRFTENCELDHNEIESLQKNLEATSVALHEKLAKIAELETSLAALTAQNSRLMQKNSTDQGELADLSAKSVLLDLELEKKDGKISDLTNRLQTFDSLQAEKLEIDGKLSEATKLYVKLETDKNKIIKETSANLNSALSDSQQRETTISSLKTEIADWKAKFGSSEEKSRNLTKEFELNQSELQQLHSQELENLKQTHSEFQALLEVDFSQKKLKLDQAETKLRSKEPQYQKTIDTLNAELTQLLHSTSELKKSNLELKKLNSEQKFDIEALKDQIQNLTKKSVEQTAKIQQFSAQKSIFEQEVFESDNLQQKLHKDLQKLTLDLNLEIQTLEGRLNSTIEEHDMFVVGQDHCIDNLRKEKDELKSRIAKMNQNFELNEKNLEGQVET